MLFVLLIAGLTFQLAQALAERNYSRKQEEFVSNITHEMKSPLAAIKLHAQTLQQADLPGGERARSVGFVLQQVRRMETLVDNVLESSRLAARKKRLTLQPVPLADWCRTYFEEMRGELDGRGLTLTTDVSTSAVVLASPDALQRILTNLLENAARFSMRGGEIRCRVVDASNLVHIEVEDDGIGIPQTELKKVFDRFYQIGSEISGRRGGTGLGLSIVWGLAAGTEGAGTGVLARGSSRHAVRRHAAGTRGRRLVTAPPARILVVEDEEALAEGLAYNLERKGYRVDLARDGREALERTRAAPYALILLDLRLPEVDGFQVCQRLRAAERLHPDPHAHGPHAAG